MHAAGFHSQRRRAAGGFTLVELMVAMTGGLFLSIMVFALSRDATRFYQQETRISNATLAGLSGFERLSSDVARAGHLISPNISDDPHVCNRPNDTWPTKLHYLRALVLDVDSSPLSATEVGKAGISPQAIEIAGALESTEELPVRDITQDANGYSVYLKTDAAAAARIGVRDGNGPANVAALTAAFMSSTNTGRAVRIVDKDGSEQYGVVASVEGAPLPVVKLLASPGLVFSGSASGVQCGFNSHATGATINSLSIVRYELRDMRTKDAAYKALFDASAAAPFETGRVELARFELDPSGVAVPGTMELIAEYAVDLRFTPMRASAAGDSTLVGDVASAVTSTYASTQLLRSMHVRLSVRSREADRHFDVSGIPLTTANDRYRIALGPVQDDKTIPHARVRTFQGDITLRNLEGQNW
jgi:type II secretory pathway pseudopilin PulG